MPQAVVFHDKFAFGWSGKGTDDLVVWPVLPVSDILMAEYPTHAMVMPCYMPGEGHIPRLKKPAFVAHADKILFSSVFIDLDGPDHKADQRWWDNAHKLAGDIGAGYYETRGGARLVWQLEKHLRADEFVEYNAQLRDWLRRLGFPGIDDTCTDPSRLYGLPFCTRDGVLQQRRYERLDPLPFAPVLVGGTSGGLSDIKTRLDIILSVETGGRNSYLTRWGGKLRREGLALDPLTEKLLEINEEYCDPPLEDYEVEAIARSMMSYDAEYEEPSEEQFTPAALTRGDEVELCERVIADLEQGTKTPIVCAKGHVWRYDPGLGTWAVLEQSELVRHTAKYAGQVILLGDNKTKRLSLRHGNCVGVSKLVQASKNRPDFFSQATDGVSFWGSFCEVSAGKVTIMPHSPDNRSTVSIPWPYIDDAYPQSFVEDLLMSCWADQPEAAQLVDLMQEIIGVALLGIAPRFQKAFIFYGDGSNGKSTVLEVMESLFPQNRVTSIPPQDWGQEYRLARLSESLLNLVAEMPSRHLFASEVVKAMISGDRMTGRRIQGTPFEFHPKAMQVMSANKLFSFSDDTHGFIRRMCIVPFSRKFTAEDRDIRLASRIKDSELPAIASWAVKGAERVLANGKYTEPEACKAALRKWVGENDQIARFLEDRPKGQGVKISAAQLFGEFRTWQEQNNHKQTWTTSTFSDKLLRHDGQYITKRRLSSGMVYVFGIQAAA